MANTDSLCLTDITDRVRSSAFFDDHESVWLGEDPERGFTAMIAVHDSTLGPGLGGTRIWHYDSLEAARDDVLRLSRGMTYKAAVAGLEYGGGKAVILADRATGKTQAMLEAYAEMLSRLRDRYITAEDVGMTSADADFLRARTPNVTGTTIGGSGDPAPYTALGVFYGIRAAVEFESGAPDLHGRTIAVQGLGSVGMALCERLHEAGARLLVADIAADKVTSACERFAAEATDTGAIVAARADILSPCALGAVVNRDTIPSIRAGIIAGSANNILGVQADAGALMRRGILYAPDYVINAGGLINVAAELAPGGYDRNAVLERIAGIPATLRNILGRSRNENLPTSEVALSIALERIRAAGGRRHIEDA